MQKLNLKLLIPMICVSGIRATSSSVSELGDTPDIVGIVQAVIGGALVDLDIASEVGTDELEDDAYQNLGQEALPAPPPTAAEDRATEVPDSSLASFHVRQGSDTTADSSAYSLAYTGSMVNSLSLVISWISNQASSWRGT